MVFDCNIYLDAARVLGAPFTWDAFDSRVAQVSKAAVPHPFDSMLDSLRAIALCTSGRFAGNETLEVWTSAHINKIVRGNGDEVHHPPTLRPDSKDSVGMRYTRKASSTIWSVP